MHGLIALYLGFFIYLIFYFKSKKRDKMAKKITLFLLVKLLILTVLYYAFFADKMTKEERKQNITKIIL